MICKQFARFFYLFLSFALLFSPLPLTAIAQELANSLSEEEITIIKANPHISYISFDTQLSDIVDILYQINEIDESDKSPLKDLIHHIEDGFSYAEYSSVFETLEYAENILHKNYKKLNDNQAEKLFDDFEAVSKKLIKGDLAATAEDIQGIRNHKRNLVVNENIEVYGKSVFHQGLSVEKDAHIDGKLKVGKLAQFKKNVKIKDTLSVKNIEVENLTVAGSPLVGDLSVIDQVVSGTLSANNAIIQNASIDSLSVNDLAITNCLNNLCVNNLSVNDQVVNGVLSVNDLVADNFSLSGGLSFDNLSVIDQLISGTASINDAIIQNASINSLSVNDLAITNCLDNLCVNNLSVNDQVISGVLSVNDLVADSFTLIGGVSFDSLSVVDQSISGTASINDAIIQNASIHSLSVNDLAINNCLDNLCVNNLSVNDQVISGTLSVNDLVADSFNLTGDLSFDTISVIDQSISGSLSVADAVVESLTVTNCIANLCVNSLSLNDETIRTFLRFQDITGGEYVGLQAPITVPSSYTLTLPSTPPTANQVLRANAITPTNLEWAAQGESVLPIASRTIYVAKFGNDITGDGSETFPYASLAQAISVANTLATSLTPVTISINTVFILKIILLVL